MPRKKAEEQQRTFINSLGETKDLNEVTKQIRTIVKAAGTEGVAKDDLQQLMEAGGLAPKENDPNTKRTISLGAGLRINPVDNRYYHFSVVPKGGFPKPGSKRRRRGTQVQPAPVPPVPSPAPAPATPVEQPKPEPTPVMPPRMEEFPQLGMSREIPPDEVEETEVHIELPGFSELFSSIFGSLSQQPENEDEDDEEVVEIRLNGGEVAFKDGRGRKEGTFRGVARIVVYFEPEEDDDTTE